MPEKLNPRRVNMDGITIGRLHYLHEVVSQRGVRKAADRLGVAPSSVSRQLAQLEHALRMAVLKPDRRAIEPTEAGQLLLDYYADYLARQEALAARLTDLQNSGETHVEIGLVQGLARDLMRDAMCRLRELHPDLTVSLRLGGMDDIVGWLERDEVHLGIVYGPPLETRTGGLEKALGVTQPLCAIVTPGHPLTRLPEVRAGDMLPYGFALPGSAYGTRKIVTQIEQENGCTFQVVLEANHLLGLRNFVAAGLGITMLPAFAAQGESGESELAAVPVAHAAAQGAEVQLLVRCGRVLPVGVQTLQRLLVRQLEGWSASGGGN